MKKQRPVNLDIGTIQLPLAALTSITHRVSGVVIFGGMAILLYFFNLSLSSADGFAEAQAMLGNALVKLLIWIVLSALGYHLIAGCKHLVMDLGIGESKEGAPVGAKIVIAISAILAVILGVWLW